MRKNHLTTIGSYKYYTCYAGLTIWLVTIYIVKKRVVKRLIELSITKQGQVKLDIIAFYLLDLCF